MLHTPDVFAVQKMSSTKSGMYLPVESAISNLPECATCWHHMLIHADRPAHAHICRKAYWDIPRHGAMQGLGTNSGGIYRLNPDTMQAIVVLDNWQGASPAHTAGAMPK